MPADFDDLINLMARLRAPDGCPWDREQTYETLAPMLLEEAYEAFEAVDAARDNPSELRDELGDLLFQVVFYAQVAQERGDFNMSDVTTAIHDKMVRRHPHVFGTEEATDTETVLRKWEAIKAAEKRAAGKVEQPNKSLLEGVSRKLPALMEAHQIGAKAARVGFDWQSVADIFDKLHEEIDELQEALRTQVDMQQAVAIDALNEAAELPFASETEATNAAESALPPLPDAPLSAANAAAAHVREELGDLLFVVTNIARHLNIEPESALKAANRKFRRRFAFIENSLAARDTKFENATMDEMEALWQAAKQS